MAMIFPGMDPYLEDPLVWHGFHQCMAVYLADHLQPQIRPRYVARIGTRTFVQTLAEFDDRLPDVPVVRRRPPARGGRSMADAPALRFVHVPDLEITENYVEILDRESGLTVVTVIEILSPTNKYAGAGRDSYLAKQAEVRRSTAGLVEIDLLRTGPSAVAVPEFIARAEGDYDYLVSVNRAGGLRQDFEIYPIGLRDRLPVIGIPLAKGDADARLDLQAVVAHTYDAGYYGETLPYDRPCRPPLDPEDQAWADELIRAAGLRNGGAAAANNDGANGPAPGDAP
jgi:hypothetical protein